MGIDQVFGEAEMAAHQFARERTTSGNARELALLHPPLWRKVAQSRGFGERHQAPVSRLTCSEQQELELDLTGQAFRALPQRGTFDVALREGRAGISVPIGVQVAIRHAVVSFSYSVTLTLGQWSRDREKPWNSTRSGALVRKADDEPWNSSVLFSERFALPATREGGVCTRIDLSVSYLLTISRSADYADLLVQPLVHDDYGCAIVLLDNESNQPLHQQSASHAG